MSPPPLPEGDKSTKGDRILTPQHHLPADIERTSFHIITEELEMMGLTPPPEHEAVVKRVIHTTADFDYARNLRFTPRAVEQAVKALHAGAVIVTDTNMALAGITKPGLEKLGGTACCYMADDRRTNRKRPAARTGHRRAGGLCERGGEQGAALRRLRKARCTRHRGDGPQGRQQRRCGHLQRPHLLRRRDARPLGAGVEVSDKFWRSAMNPTRKTDESFYRLFSASHTVSEHLTKREDSELRDKYDHNAFCYYSQPSADEVRAALAYQKERGDTFLKLEGYEPLADAFGMECEETLTMVLPPETDIRNWKTNPDVSIKAPDADQLEQHELKYYGPLYGDDFTVRNNRNLREKLTYLGAYLGGKLVGDCYIFASDGYVCMDGLLVDEDFRHQYIAMTLMKHIAEKAQERGEILYLHADSEDTPKELYAKMGFQTVDKLYEYLCTDFSKLKI